MASNSQKDSTTKSPIFGTVGSQAMPCEHEVQRHSHVILVQWCGDFKVEYLREFVAILKKAVTRVSVAQGELFDEKKKKIEDENLMSGSL
jgi:hypothetical protein